MLVNDMYDKLALITGFPVYTNATDCPDINRFLLEMLSEGLQSTVDDLYISNNVLERNDTIITNPNNNRYGIDGIIKSLQLIDDKGRVHRLPYNERAFKDRVPDVEHVLNEDDEEVDVELGKGMPKSYVIKKGYLKLIPAPDKEYTLKVCVSTTSLVAADNDIGRSTIEHIDDTVLADNRFCNLVILKAATFVFGRCQNPNAQIYANLYETRLATYLEHDLKTLESYRGFNRGGGHFRTDQGLLGDGGFY